MPLVEACFLAVVCSALVASLAFIFLEIFQKLFYRWGFYASLFDRFVERSRHKVHAQVERFGYLGVILFIAVPLPLSWAWIGTLDAWLRGLGRRKTIMAVAGGVVVSGIIDSIRAGFGVETLGFLIEHV